MAIRKTVSLRSAIETANTFLATSEPLKQGERKGIASFLEVLLTNAGAYQGFQYLPSAGLQREEGKLVEIEDESRRSYFIHPEL
jgi:hypothetical protein